MKKQFITTKQLCKILGRHPNTITNWIKKYKMPHYRAGNSVLYIWEEVEKWMKEVK